MKTRYILAAAAAVILLLAAGCRRATDNGEIDGNWRVDTVEDLATGTVAPPAQRQYIAFQLELVQCRTLGDCWTGIIDYKKNAKQISMHFPYLPERPAALLGFGIAENPVSCTIEKADHKHLIFTTPTSRVTCTRW